MSADRNAETELCPNFVVMDRLPGSPLADCAGCLSEQACFAAYADMGRQLRQVHAIGLGGEGFGYIGTAGVVKPFASFVHLQTASETLAVRKTMIN